MGKFISAIRSQTLDQRVEGGGEKLKTVEEAKIADLENLTFLRCGWYNIDWVGSVLTSNVLHNEMRVVPLQIMKDDGDHARILCHHVISGVQIVVVSGNVFIYRFHLRFGSRIRVRTFFIFQFEIARIAIWTDVNSGKMAVMFRRRRSSSLLRYTWIFPR